MIMCSSIHASNRHLLSTCCAPGTVLGTRDDDAQTEPALMVLTI